MISLQLEAWVRGSIFQFAPRLALEDVWGQAAELWDGRHAESGVSVEVEDGGLSTREVDEQRRIDERSRMESKGCEE